jgi:hypothetical protein
MPPSESDLLPETIRCPFCNARMDLYEEERISKKFDCPACNREIDLRNTPSQLMNMFSKMGKNKK